MRRLTLALAFVVCVFMAPLSGAQEPGAPVASASQPGATAADAQEAPLSYYNRNITVFRSPLFGVAPEGRARRAREVLDAILSEPGPGVVTTQSEPQGNLVLVDGQLAFIVIEGDADRLKNETLASITADAATRLRDVIAVTREARDRSRILWSVASVLGATVVLVAFFSFLAAMRRRVDARLDLLSERVARVARVGGAQLISADRFRPIVRFIVGLLRWTVVLGVTYRWLSFALSQFPFTRPWGNQLRFFTQDTAITLGRAVVGSLPGLAVALTILLLAWAVLRLFLPFFDHVAAGRVTVAWLDRDTARPTKRIVMLGTWLFALAMAYPYLPGSDTEAFQGMSVLLGLMVTFGGSSLFGQAASGLILLYSRTLRVGEFVKIADQEGTVTELGTFTTRVRTGLGEELTLPNAVVLGGVVKNYSRAVKGHGYIVDTTVTIGYDTPWRQVEAMLIAAARRTQGILDDPPPVVFQTALSDFYPEYRLVCQAVPREPRPRAEVMTLLHANIQDVFNEHGVQIMSPHYKSDPGEAKVVPRERWHAAPAKPPSDGAR